MKIMDFVREDLILPDLKGRDKLSVLTELASLSLFTISALVAGCGPSKTVITVGGHALVVHPTGGMNYGQGDYFCADLANGQYEILISDTPLCDDLHHDAGNKTTFHSSEE